MFSTIIIPFDMGRYAPVLNIAPILACHPLIYSQIECEPWMAIDDLVE
jgi:hypothetical protein